MARASYSGTTPSKVNSKLSADQWLKAGKWVNVTSSNVAAILYVWKWGTLYVRFKGGSEYRYAAVPKRTAKDFYHATSMGKFLAYRIKGNYSYTKIK